MAGQGTRQMTPKEIAKKRRGGRAGKKAAYAKYGGSSGIHHKKKGEWKDGRETQTPSAGNI